MHKGGGSPSCGGSRCTDACQRFLLARSVSRRGGNPPAPAFPRQGETGKGAIEFLAAAGDFGPDNRGRLFLASLCPFASLAPVVVITPIRPHSSSVCAALLPYALSMGLARNLAARARCKL